MLATQTSAIPTFTISNLNLQDRRDLYIKPLKQYLLNAASPLLRVVSNVKGEGYNMDSLQGSDVVVQNGRTATWNPQGEVAIESKLLKVAPFKVNMEWTNEEFYDTILEKMGGLELNRGNLDATEEGRALKQAMVSLIMQDIQRNIFDVAMFGDPTLNKSDLSCTSTNSKVTATEMTNRAFDMLTTTKGIIKSLKDSPGSLVGQLLHNEAALPDGYAIDAFKMVKKKDNRLIKNMTRDVGIVCSGSIYENYYDYLEDTEQSANGRMVTVNGMETLSWRGIPIFPMEEFHDIDSKYFGKNDRHFAGATTYNNIFFGNDIEATTKDPVLKVGQLAEPREETTYAKARFKLGFDIAHPELANFAFSWLAAN